jgi:hypothetical protein
MLRNVMHHERIAMGRNTVSTRPNDQESESLSQSLHMAERGPRDLLDMST